MKFGLFEHMDDSGVPLGRQFESRLSLLEACDRYGFYAYHLAEHHGTPLGLAPSPGLFLAAVAQRTKRLRFGPLAYSLPLYHPIRLIEEICMLDQMSGGRFELGVGRGVSPFEVGFFGVNPADGSRQFPEALRLIKQGLTSDELSFSGEFYKFSQGADGLKAGAAAVPSPLVRRGCHRGRLLGGRRKGPHRHLGAAGPGKGNHRQVHRRVEETR
jgi:alkanesulfonate monooxygenase SsuD/methylene tetrahydromethanopterin reductase-like flavin-dependent oxidoreductase (luciferase family)